MTCIVGMRDKSSVIIGGDSLASNAFYKTARGDSKVFCKDGYVVGFSSSYRMGQLLAHTMDFPVPPETSNEKELLGFMVSDFIEKVRDCFDKGGFLKKENEVIEGGSFIIGVNGCLFSVIDDFQVEIPSIGFAACGSGSDYALGSMYSTIDMKLSPAERIELALKASEKFSTRVGGPFIVMSQGVKNNSSWGFI